MKKHIKHIDCIVRYLIYQCFLQLIVYDKIAKSAPAVSCTWETTKMYSGEEGCNTGSTTFD